MTTTIISTENKLQNILDFDFCKKMIEVERQICNDLGEDRMIILCPHYSINIASKYEDGEELQWDLEEFGEYVGEVAEVNDYDDLVIYFTYDEERADLED